ncbi:MAG: hypothetical protein ACT4OY_04825 [Alphaproteobacteria bacterium]
MPTTLPLDTARNPIPALRLKASGAHTVAASGTSARNSTAFNDATKIVSLYSTAAVYIKFGTSSVTAAVTDHYFPAGTYYDFAVGDADVGHYTHVAVLQVSDAGTVYISEKE